MIVIVSANCLVNISWARHVMLKRYHPHFSRTWNIHISLRFIACIAKTIHNEYLFVFFYVRKSINTDSFFFGFHHRNWNIQFIVPIDHSCVLKSLKILNKLKIFPPGRGSGSFGGGLLIAQLGTREAFRYMGLIAFLGGILYGLLHYFWLRNISMTGIDDACEQDTGKFWLFKRLLLFFFGLFGFYGTCRQTSV